MTNPKIEERWRPLYGYEDSYKISESGKIYSFFSKRLLIPQKDRRGYMATKILGKTFRIHRLVALSFGIIEESDWVNHIDANKINNQISNLEKSNRLHNVRHAHSLGLAPEQDGENNGNAKLTNEKVLSIRKEYKKLGGCRTNVAKLAKKYKVHPCAIWRVATRRSWKNV